MKQLAAFAFSCLMFLLLSAFGIANSPERQQKEPLKVSKTTIHIQTKTAGIITTQLNWAGYCSRETTLNLAAAKSFRLSEQTPFEANDKQNNKNTLMPVLRYLPPIDDKKIDNRLYGYCQYWRNLNIDMHVRI